MASVPVCLNGIDLQFAKFDFKFSLKIKDLSTIINQDTIYYIPYLFSTSSRIVTA